MQFKGMSTHLGGSFDCDFTWEPKDHVSPIEA
jgi:hypothetical protein